MSEEKASRAERTERVERHRQIRIGEFRTLQIFHEVGIEPIDMRIDSRAIDAHVPAEIHIEREVADEIAEHQQRHQRDQAVVPDIALPGHARRPHPSCCPGNVRHVQSCLWLEFPRRLTGVRSGHTGQDALRIHLPDGPSSLLW
ncbi:MULTISPECIES: hypothetical protein [Bradyrhizobium]|uniref:hypothetical protein n=1 Tax=Bradyrhizobium TaxID=374 RepID=UPI0004857704|nr:MULTISPECIES: hypothetical protein [Bradyrhizobium]UFW46683.1 hypothetical protein BaraCB756_30975 [Bradyrhizobium arachidis]